MTGRTFRACRTGKMSAGRWIPQSHRGRSAIERMVDPLWVQAEPPIELTSTSARHRSVCS